MADRGDGKALYQADRSCYSKPWSCKTNWCPGLLDGDCMVSRDCLKVSRLHNGFPRMLNGVVRVNSLTRQYGASRLHDVASLLGVVRLHGEARPFEDAARLLHGFMGMLDGIARLAGVAKLHGVSRLSEGLIRLLNGFARILDGVVSFQWYH